jgi:hypothetical protein
MKSAATKSHFCAVVLSTVVFLGSAGCMKHRAKLETMPLPPPAGERVLHTGRLWIDVLDLTKNTQCANVAGHQPLCFEKVRNKLQASLKSVLWPSFPDVEVRGPRDRVEAGDYVLSIELMVEPLPPSDRAPGWSTGARGRWELVRDGAPVAGAAVASQSRAEFAYGRPLAIAAGEVIDAVAMHVATVLYVLPERQQLEPNPLPPVAARPTLAKTANPLAKRGDKSSPSAKMDRPKPGASAPDLASEVHDGEPD